MKDSYNLYTRKLEGEYKQAFGEIETYGFTYSLDNILFEEKMTELLDVFISAQEEGRSVENIVGDDVDAFVENFFSEIPRTSYLYEFLDTLKRIAWLIVFVEGISLLIDFGGDTRSSIDFGMGVFLFASSYILSRAIAVVFRKCSFQMNIGYKLKRTLLVLMQLILVVILCCFAFIVLKPCISIPAAVEFTGAAIYLIFYYAFNRKRLKEDKEVRGSKPLSEEVGNNLVDEMKNKFEKGNSRLEKKGKEKIGWDTFVEKEIRTTNQLRIVNKACLFFPIVLILCVDLLMYFNNGFVSFSDMLSFTAIILIVEYLIFGLFYKIESGIIKARENWANSLNDD